MAYARVLIGTDFSEPSEAAAKLAIRLGDEKTRCRVAHVSPFVEMPREIDLNADVQRSKLFAWCDAAGLTTRDQVVLYGSAASELVREAASFQADLIAVGHSGRSRLDRLLLGSTARGVVRLAACDALVVRGHAPPPTQAPIQSVLVATDFYEPSSRAARRALELAKAHDASLSVVHAIDPDIWQQALRTPPDELPDAPEWLDRKYGEMLHDFDRKHLEGKAKEHLAHGPPAKVVAQQARLQGADLIVVGTHGARGLERLLLGAHAESIIERAPCSVLVVR